MIRLLVIWCVLLAACAAPRPVIKIALVAPFEGRLRQIGYEAFPAMRLAIRERVASGNAGSVYVTFIAYNDDGDPATAARIARNVALDPEVVGVIGHLVLSTTLAALSVYTQAGLPVLAPSVPANALPHDPLVFRMAPRAPSHNLRQSRAACATLDSSWMAVGWPFGTCIADAPPVVELPDAQRALAAFTELSLGPPPGPRSIVAYDATNVLLDAIALDARANGLPTRAGVADALRRIRRNGLLGQIRFDDRQIWADAPAWAYVK
ncbi:MAG: ABC transporter substrate-binding protein [Thermoflexales bacterium]|nr:ABC transporter substrate-binding protein [Thermoflexales bacterium]MDW8351382.1 ABC transporter substrate-binding protein [Anaerolineae bacterium]